MFSPQSDSAQSWQNSGHEAYRIALPSEASVMFLTFVNIIGTNYTNKTNVNYWPAIG